MIFHDGPFVTVWEIKSKNDNYVRVRISSSRKDKETNEYFTDFSGFVSLIGAALKKFPRIESAIEEDGRCRIKINTFSISNRYDREEGKEYNNYGILDFSFQDEDEDENAEAERPKKAAKKSAKSADKKKSKPSASLLDDSEDESEDDEDMPF